MVGDRMDTDIISGMESGMSTVLVLSGVSSRDTLKTCAYRPSKRIKFDSEAGMFYMYCSDGDMLQEVISRFVEELKATGLKEYVEKIDFETL